MSLFDDSTARNLESSVETMTSTHDNHTGGPAVLDAPEHAQPSSADQTSAIAEAPEMNPQHENSEAPAPETATAASDDFAAALHNFETETEEAVGEDHVIKGRVVKLTATHVVVDYGAKSEGMVPLAEVLDHEGKPKFQPGDEIDVMRDKGETEEGYINLSHQKAQKLRAWDEIEKAYNEKKPIRATVVERIKGGLTVDIMGASAFLPARRLICAQPAISTR